MIFLQPLEMCVDRCGDLLEFFTARKMPHDLTIMFGLPRKTKCGVLLLCNFGIGHYLDLLRRVCRTGLIRSRLRALPSSTWTVRENP